MKKIEYKTKEGKEGVRYELEKGDEFVPSFPSPREWGSFGKFSIGAKDKDGNDMYVTLTKAQGKMLNDAGDVNGKTIEAYEYENKFGTFVGVRVKKSG